MSRTRRFHAIVQRRASGGRLVLLGLQIETFQRAHDCPDGVGGDARVERRRIQFRMSERPRAIMRTFLCH
jgi:hypothetical protein